jgi:hypothetical protein
LRRGVFCLRKLRTAEIPSTHEGVSLPAATAQERLWWCSFCRSWKKRRIAELIPYDVTALGNLGNAQAATALQALDEAGR